MAISEKTIKVLWARARNRCAYPGCQVSATNQLTDATSGEVFYTPGLEQAHIRSKSEDGPRFDAEYPNEKLDSFENLILLCGAHHAPVVDAEDGRAYTANQLERMKKDHEANHNRLEELEETITKYLGEQYSVDDKVLFEQAELRGPTVESMFVDVPFTCRDDAPVAEILRDISEKYPGDLDAAARAGGQPAAGAAQTLLSTKWQGNALLVAGPGQGKSTLLQYVCQVHRARMMSRNEYDGQAQDLDLADATVRLPIRIDLRNYASWARTQTRGNVRKTGQDGRGRGRGRVAKPAASNSDWPTIEEFLAHDITTRAASGKRFMIRDLGTLVSTRPVLIALDGLDEVADLADRESVSEHVVKMNGRLQASSIDLIVLVASRPGGTTPQLWSSVDFPRMDLLPLSHGLRVQYLRRWCSVANLGEDETAHLQRQFLENENLSHIRDLASYPMQLAILLHLLYRRQLMPQRRTELYDEYFKTFLDREQAQFKEPLLATDRPLVVSVHAFLGWYIHTETEAGRAAGAIKKSELKRQLRVFLSDRENGLRLADKLFAAITTRMLCLVEREHGSFQFDVQTLREYFAAVYLFEEVDRDKRDHCLRAMLRRPYWSNVLRFFAGRYSIGEIRGIKALLQELRETSNFGDLPQLRATAALLLADRAYHSQTSHPVQDIVDLILEGNGVVFAEDGLLESSNGHLVLSDGAGRSQAVAYLKNRLEVEDEPEMARVLAKSLARHAGDADGIEKWAYAAFDDDARWFARAAYLRAFKTHLPSQEQRIANAMADYVSDRQWPSELLAHGRYQRRDDAVVSAIVADLNDGALEVLTPARGTSPLTPLALAKLAKRAQRDTFRDGSRDSTARYRTRERAGARLFGDIAAATDMLGDRPTQGTAKQWATRLDAIATAWGDGWILHRAIAATPADVDLGVAAGLATDRRVADRLEAHRAMREARGKPDSWARRIRDAVSEVERALLAIDLLTYAHVAVLVENSSAINALFTSLSPKHFTAAEIVLRTEGRLVGGQLFLDHLESTSMPELQADYVETFDNRRRCNLFLTYFAHGDTRKRGMALLRFKQTYLRAGFELDDAELPDHLCVVLEFAATIDRDLGRDLMLDHRAGLELLRLSLQDMASPWASLINAVTLTLPALRGEERDAVRRLAAEGPPEEEVGLAPFASPQFSPGAASGAAPEKTLLPMPSFPGARA